MPLTASGQAIVKKLADIRAHGGDVRLGTPVRTISRDAGAFRLDADERRFDRVIIACGPQHAASLMEPFAELAPARALIEALDYEPIVTCYLQYAAEVKLPSPMLGIHEGIAQWLFDRGQLDGHAGLIAAVISASGPHDQLSREALVGRVHAEVSAAIGALPASFVVLLLSGGSVAAVLAFTLVMGASQGVITIVRGAVPLALFIDAYGWRLAWVLLGALVWVCMVPPWLLTRATFAPATCELLLPRIWRTASRIF